MKFKREELPYRKGAIGIIKNPNEKFLIVQMVSYNDNEWRFPGGGIEEGEEPQDAVIRELAEELGTDKFNVLKKSNISLSFEWPDHVIEKQFKKRGKMYRGQQQAQFLMDFVGSDNDIKVDPVELKNIKWVSYEELETHFVFPHQWEETKKTFEDLA